MLPNDNIVLISLTCNEEHFSCEDKVLQDKHSIRLFENAIRKAEKMEGDLNYEEEYELKIVTSNEKVYLFHLSLGSDRSMNGLLVKQPYSSQGYRISYPDANELKDLLGK